MSNKVKDVSIKNYTYYFFNDLINIENFEPNNINIDEKSYKNTLIYYIGYVTIKDSKYVKVNNVNCDGAVLEIYLNHKFQWPQEGLNCESLAYEVIT